MVLALLALFIGESRDFGKLMSIFFKIVNKLITMIQYNQDYDS